MRRWWKTPSRPPARGMRRRVGRVLMRAMIAGAVSLPIPSRSAVVTPARTSGAVIEAWAFGTLSDATQPDSAAACDLAHVCALAISSAGGAGTGTGTTVKTSFESTAQGELPPNLPFVLTETIDYAHPVTRGAGVNGDPACYPATGVMTIALDASSILVLDVLGQACHTGRSMAQLVFTGSYVTDAASTGKFANPDGIGSININNPSGLPGTLSTMKASLVGQLKYGG